MTYILFLIFFSFRSRTSVAMGAISPILPRPAILTFASILALAAILTIILLHTFRFRQQHLTGKFEFSGFRINIDQFHTGCPEAAS
mgnify:CR=1 FL=1